MKIKRFNKFIPGALLCVAFCYCPNLFAQIKVGNNPASLNPNAALEIESDNKGLLLPRIALSSTKSASPLSSFVPGMFVYNTATTKDITPGAYYSDGAKWVRVNSLTPTSVNTGTTVSDSWNLSGNSGIDSTGNFLGTTDNAPLILKTNSEERLRISENGWVGVGTSTPSAALQVKGQVVIDSISTGNAATDNVLVTNPADGKVKMVPSNNFILGMQQRTEVVQTAGQTIFNTPAVITDINKILLYRNGVLISFSIKDTNSIESEMLCFQGDEIKIFQLK